LADSKIVVAAGLLIGLVAAVGDYVVCPLPKNSQVFGTGTFRRLRKRLGLVVRRSVAWLGNVPWISRVSEKIPVPSTCVELMTAIAVLVSAELASESGGEGRWPLIRPPEEDPKWMSELARFPRFRLILVWAFKRLAHINVLEVKVYRSLVKVAGKESPSTRHLYLQDSNVGLGAEARGRSSAKAVNFQLQLALPYVLGFDFYGGGFHARSKENVADDPTRDAIVREPSIAEPWWVQEVVTGNFVDFDLMVAGDSLYSRPYAGWWRLLFRVAGGVPVQ